jgi:two-component system, OmpR family, response regulator
MKTENPKKIFIVDDDIVYLEILKNEVSELNNVKVYTFTSAEECLMQMDKKPDLIIIDFYLNSTNPRNMNGHQALEELFIENPKIKVLFISGETNENLLEEYRKYRFIEFVVKTDFGSNQIQQKILDQLKAA